MRKVYCDIETRSRVDLKKSNVYRYVECPDFEILLCAYAVEDGPIELLSTPEEIADVMREFVFDPDTVLWAHNAAFERVCFSAYYGLPVGTYLDPAEWDDTMPLASEHGYPASLDGAAKALGAPEKDSAGSHLIRYFSVPNRKGTFNGPEDSPERWEEFGRYVVQDVDTLREIARRLPAWPPGERELFVADQRINDRGIRLDRPLAEAAVDAGEINLIEQELEFIGLTGVDNPNSLPQVLAWFESHGLPLPNLRAETVEATLKELRSAPENARDEVAIRVLELRQDLALVASKKYLSALGSVSSDDRLRGAFRFFGAHTGRWAGRGVQLHNLPRAQLDSEEETEAAIAALHAGDGAGSYTLKALVRALFTGPFVVSDYSAIEARVVAWLAGEQWVLDAFEAGRDIYVETAGRMFDLDEEAARARRHEGKVAVLALGYNGGVGSLRAMGAEGVDAHLQGLVDRWRRTNPAIVEMWKDLDAAFYHGGEVGSGRIRVEVEGRDRYVRLPSGRAITFHGVAAKTEMGPYGPRRRLTFRDPRRNWARVDTYGGRLTENVTQAVARDVLGAALIELADRGYPVVGHVHDEVLVEGGPDDLDEVVEAMCAKPSWAEGLPIAAEAFTTNRYRKD